MTKAVKITTKCEHCGNPVSFIITQDKLGELVAKIKLADLMRDLTLGKQSFAEGINIQNKKGGVRINGKNVIRRYKAH